MAQNIFHDMLRDATQPARLIPAMCSGFVIGLLGVIIELSFASLIFSGPLAPFAPAAAGLTLFGGFLFCLVVSLCSEFPTSISLPQDAPAAIMATVAGGLAVSDSFSDPMQSRFTVAAAMMLSTLATGLFFLLLGRFRLGNLMRYMPYPVVGGFLAGIGWLLVQGGVSIATGVSLNMAGLPQLLTQDKLLSLLPSVLLVAALMIGLMRWGSPFVLPATLALAGAAFALYLAANGLTLDDANRAGMLLGGMPGGTLLWPVFTPSDIGQIDWNALLPQLPKLCTIPLVSAMSLLLIASGLETAAKRDLDLTRELYVNALANVLGSAGGSHAGYTALSLSLLGPKTGSDSRLVGLLCALVMGCATFLGATVLSYFPRFILGGMVLFLGVATLLDWVVAVRAKVSRMEYGLILAILMAISMLGFLEGVGLGLLLAAGIFIIKYSRLPVLRRITDASRTSSAQVRSVPDRHILRQNGQRVRILSMTGYLFFGSASVLSRTVNDLLHPAQGEPPSHLILDFSAVDGVDSSAVNSFVRIVQRCATVRCQPLLCAVPAGLEKQMRSAAPQDADMARFLPDLDRALELAEDELLRSVELSHGDSGRDTLFEHSVDDLMLRLEDTERFESLVERLAPHLHHASFAPGEVIQRRGEPWPGVWLLVTGNAEQLTSGDGGAVTRLRSLGPGELAGCTHPHRCPDALADLVATDHCELALLHADRLRELEQAQPADALSFYSVYAAFCVSGC